MEDIRARAAATALPLNSQHISRRATTFNRLFAAIYSGAILALFYHHMASLLTPTSLGSFFVSVSLFISDIILAFMWVNAQSFRMNPLHRREYPGNLKESLNKDSDFPALDVFICTADPYKEPPINVVNTALSVMAYDYPTCKISVYVSDDGGSALTLFAFMEAARFAAEWLPFCRKNGVVERNPDAFFTFNKDRNSETDKMKEIYEKMKMKVENVVKKGKVGDELVNGEEELMALNQWTKSFTPKRHPSLIKVLLESAKSKDVTREPLPNLIYVSRQKSESSPHHFKAGALNTLLRVSATMTNAPIILTLDCDNYSNDPQTPLRVLCYFLDPKLATTCGYVQFPQRFNGVSKNDIYAGELKRLFIINSIGMDGLLGANYVGTGCFFVRRIFFGGPSSFQSPELSQLGPSHVVEKPIKSPQILELAHRVAGCDYETNTQWGYKLGFKYGSLVEDYFSGFRFQSEGWNSVFCNPNRAAFYGDVPISLPDVLNQVKRWAVGLLEVGFSKYSPVTFGVRSMGLLMGLSYAHYAFWPLWSIPVAVYAFLPQLALINGAAIFPNVWDPWFAVYVFLFVGAYGQDLLDFVFAGGTFRKWWNDQRMWSVRSLSCLLFGTMEFVLQSVGYSNFGFNVTSKVMDPEQRKRYEEELFEFGVFSPMFVPIATVAIVNLAGGIIGIWRSCGGGGGMWEAMLPQLLVVGFAVANCWPVYEAMGLRKDGGKMPPKITFLSVLLALFLCCFAVLLLCFVNKCFME